MEKKDINYLWERMGLKPPPVPYAQYYWDIFIVTYDNPEHPILRLMDIDGVVYNAAREACTIQSDPGSHPRYIIANGELVRISCQKAIDPFDDQIFTYVVIPLVKRA